VSVSGSFFSNDAARAAHEYLYFSGMQRPRCERSRPDTRLLFEARPGGFYRYSGEIGISNLLNVVSHFEGNCPSFMGSSADSDWSILAS
jgi:hypothetical protein